MAGNRLIVNEQRSRLPYDPERNRHYNLQRVISQLLHKGKSISVYKSFKEAVIACGKLPVEAKKIFFKPGISAQELVAYLHFIDGDYKCKRQAKQLSRITLQEVRALRWYRPISWQTARQKAIREMQERREVSPQGHPEEGSLQECAEDAAIHYPREAHSSQNDSSEATCEAS
ncbi:MAG: hypothetical protein MPJ22_00610 [Pirellulales bacterium]|nr:hypothetical protein [Pirellulales bacterium]MDA8040910.1 hypothetical protein [Pirellulales bacterium]